MQRTCSDLPRLTLSRRWAITIGWLLVHGATAPARRELLELAWGYVGHRRVAEIAPRPYKQRIPVAGRVWAGLQRCRVSPYFG